MSLVQYMVSVSHLWCEHFYRLLSSRCDTEKGGGKGKGHWIDNRTRLTAVQPGATWALKACARRGALAKPPPRGLWTDFGNLAQSQGWPPFWRL